MRPTYDAYFMSLAHAAATMGTCSRRQVGAVAVRDKRVLATGFNGSPAGTHHCEHERYGAVEPVNLSHCVDSWSRFHAIWTRTEGSGYVKTVWQALERELLAAKSDVDQNDILERAKALRTEQSGGDDPDLILVAGRPSCSNAVHAEANVIAYAAASGVALRGSTIYTNTFPCHGCAKQMVSCGIVEVVFDADYFNDPLVTRLFEEAKVNIRRFVPSK